MKTDDLFAACKADDLEAVLVFLQLDNRLFEKSHQNGVTPTHFAARYGAVKVLSLFLTLDPKCTILRDAKGFTPFFRAVEFGRMEAMHILLHFRLDSLFDVDDMGETPLHRAAFNNQIEACHFIFSRAPSLLQSKDKREESCLFQACRTGNPELIRFLLQNGAEPNDVNMFGSNCLHVAVESSRFIPCIQGLDMVRVLFEFGTHVDCQNELGQTPLSLAIEHRLFEVIVLLLQEGHANPDVGIQKPLEEENAFFWTPFWRSPSSFCIHADSPLSRVIKANDEEMIKCFEIGIGKERVKERLCELSSLVDPFALVNRHMCIVNDTAGGVEETAFCVEAFRKHYWFGAIFHVLRMENTGEERTVKLHRPDSPGVRFFLVSDQVFEHPLMEESKS